MFIWSCFLLAAISLPCRSWNSSSLPPPRAPLKPVLCQITAGLRRPVWAEDHSVHFHWRREQIRHWVRLLSYTTPVPSCALSALPLSVTWPTMRRSYNSCSLHCYSAYNQEKRVGLQNRSKSIAKKIFFPLLSQRTCHTVILSVHFTLFRLGKLG